MDSYLTEINPVRIISQKRVRFNLPRTLVIYDTILGVRRTIPFYSNLSLQMLPRFFLSSSSPPHIKSKLNNNLIDIHLPLRKQGVYPGDILIVYR
jgi:hypothetical protein